MPLDPSLLDPDPLVELARWVADAEAAGHRLPNAFALATADSTHRPAVRMVLLTGVDATGLVFHTNRDSRKGRDLAANPRAAAVFWWEGTNRQVRVSGAVLLLDDATSDAYWASRPVGHQLAAWASAQSEPVDDRSSLEAQVESVRARFGSDGPVPRPPFWGGFQLTADVVELWESREDRLHDRLEYRRRPEGGWDRRRLQP
jgi:pyridoxamine 5'-phosphate oxidase